MKILTVAWIYAKRYPLLSVLALISIVLASFFEGASFGMLIPLIQSMMGTSTSALFGKIPLLKNLNLQSLLLSQTVMVTALLVFLLLLLITKNFFIFMSNLFIARLRFYTIRDMNTKLMDNLIYYDMRYFDNAKSGNIISIFTTETVRMGKFMLSILQLLLFFGRILAYLALLFYISFKVSLLVCALVALVLMVLEPVMKNLKKLGAELSQAMAEYNSKMVDILSGIRLIKTCGTEEREKGSFADAVKRAFRSNYKSSLRMNSITPISEVFIFLIVIGSFLFVIHAWRIDLALALPFCATYLIVFTKTLGQLNAFNNNRSEIINNMAAFEKYDELYDEKGKRTIESGGTIFAGFSNEIEFRDASFSYVDGKPVLENISLKIPKGRITAIVGASGAGKSTMINLILRFYDVASGHILVDGFDLRRLDLTGWRKKIGLVSQDIFIFNMSMKDNISYGHSGVGEEKIIEAAKAANAHEFIMKLPKGYDTFVGERGIRLSGGQRQRISIARAIIHNPEILILDEATSSLDTKTEMLINEAIDRLTSDRTVIAIAHRLSTILHADNIIVLHEGRVAETGPHANLIGRNGLYKRLYDAQFIK